MSLKHRVVALERHRDGGRFIYLTTRPTETVEVALTRKGIVPRERDYVLAHAGFDGFENDPDPDQPSKFAGNL